MSKGKRNPFRGFMDVVSEMNRTQHQWMMHGDKEPQHGARTHASAWVPAADIYAVGGNLVIRCELAGLRREDVDVSVSSGVLTISGDRHSELDENKVTWYTRERTYGRFRRTMVLPEGITGDDVTAHYENGLLEITIQSGAAANVQHVSISGEETSDGS